MIEGLSIMSLHHASCVEIEGKGIVIFGPSGSGKSDLAIRLIDAGGKLVSDDYVTITNEGNVLYAYPAPNIEGMIEMRGVGLIKLSYLKISTLVLALNLVTDKDIERLPEKNTFRINKAIIPLYNFNAFSVSAIAKIKLLLRSL